MNNAQMKILKSKILSAVADDGALTAWGITLSIAQEAPEIAVSALAHAIDELVCDGLLSRSGNPPSYTVTASGEAGPGGA